MGSIISLNSNSSNSNINLNLNIKEINQINFIWEEILNLSNGSIELGKIAFEGLFQKLPESFELFHSFNKLNNWNNSKQFLHHCSIVSKVLGYIIKVINNSILFEKNIDYMGMRHSLLAVTPQQFEVLGQEYGKAIKQIVGDKFTPELQESWIVLYTFIASQIQNYITQYKIDFNYERLVSSKPQTNPPPPHSNSNPDSNSHPHLISNQINDNNESNIHDNMSVNNNLDAPSNIMINNSIANSSL